MRALLVEDDAAFALLARSVLEQEGFAVDTATTGNDALGFAHATNYDCILLDLGLPDANGITVVQALRREGRNTPVHGAHRDHGPADDYSAIGRRRR
jgi:two-component system OmpR family response regulator